MKKVSFCIFAMFICMGIFAQQPVVAVAPFEAISGISSTDANMITRVFFIRLGNTNRVSLVDRSVVERVIIEHRFQTGDWSNTQKTAELGKALNTDWIVRGELEKFGNNILVTVQFYDIQTFRFMGGSDLLLTSVEEAMQKMDPLVDKLVQTITSAGEKTPRAQGGNTSASTYYGTWLMPKSVSGRSTDMTLSIEANKFTLRDSSDSYVVIINCTWTPENNIDTNTLADYPKGFKVSGMVTDNKGHGAKYFMPLYLFIHKSDNNKMYLQYTPDSTSEVFYGRYGPFGRIQ